MRQLTVDRAAKPSSAPSATGPTPDLTPDASRFITLVRAMRALQVKHRGCWFYAADDDLDSRSTFMLLVQLFVILDPTTDFQCPSGVNVDYDGATPDSGRVVRYRLIKGDDAIVGFERP